jgi:predicted peptidase
MVKVMEEMMKLFEARTFTQENGESLPYRLMKPQLSNPNGRYPVLLFLHGSGGNGSNNIENMTDTKTTQLFASESFRNKHPAYIIVPHCPINHSWSKNIRRSNFPEIKHLVLKILKLVCEEFNVDLNRIYITGLSRGGFGTLGMVVAQPETFAAAAPVCGGWDPADAEKIAGVPSWFFHGDADNVVKTDFSRNMVSALEAINAPVKYTEYNGVGHNCWDRAYGTNEFWDWLFSQKK